MSKEVRFEGQVSQIVYDPENGLVVDVSSTPLQDENDVATRTSEFQETARGQKRALHQHHISRKKCRLRMREDIKQAFWNVYEQEAWNRMNELIIGNEQITTFVDEALRSVDKTNIVKLWREQCMMLSPLVEQHEMVPFHERWVQQQFKEEENIEAMKQRIVARVEKETESLWLTELVNEMCASPTPTPELHFDRIAYALDELEALNPEIFELLPEQRPNKEQMDLTDQETDDKACELDITDAELVTAMENWEQNEIQAVLDNWDYSYLLTDEVSTYHLELVILFIS